MKNPPELAGQWVACPLCRQQFVLPPLAPPAMPSPPLPAAQLALGYPPQHPAMVAGQYVPQRGYLDGLKIPVLISAIFNVMWAMLLVLSCYGIILVIPVIVLCVFEFVYYSNADQQPPRKAIADGRTLGVCEIIVGILTMNMATLICGILALVNASNIERKLHYGY